MTDKMMLAGMFLAATSVIAIVALLCTVRFRKRRAKEYSWEFREIPEEIYRQDAYETRYIYARQNSFASCKTIRIRPEYYDRLRQITEVVGRSNLSLIAYMDHVLRAHFEDNGAYIAEFCRKETRSGDPQ